MSLFNWQELPSKKQRTAAYQSLLFNNNREERYVLSYTPFILVVS